jgi:hypothetical protein
VGSLEVAFGSQPHAVVGSWERCVALCRWCFLQEAGCPKCERCIDLIVWDPTFEGCVGGESISVLLGLIMVTHLGPGHDSNSAGAERSRSKAGKALLLHLAQYQAKGFRVTSVTSDGEGAVKSSRNEIQALGVELNILGRGSHAPHAESAIRHIKNKARSTLQSLLFKISAKSDLESRKGDLD